MRPTVEEQLLGLRAVLQGVVAPEVRAPYPTDLLATVVGALERLAGEWATVPAALRSESAALDGLLSGALDRARPVVGPGAVAAIGAVLAEPAPDWLDPAAARAHYERRRALLADVVRALAPDGAAAPELWSAVVAHLREHLLGPL